MQSVSNASKYFPLCQSARFNKLKNYKIIENVNIQGPLYACIQSAIFIIIKIVIIIIKHKYIAVIFFFSFFF